MRLGAAAVLSLAGAIALSGCPKSGGTCLSSAGCSPTEYCQQGACVPKISAGPCADGADHQATDVCQSKDCMSGNCCASQCSGDPVCGATGCNSSGGCLYPGANVACGPPEACGMGSYQPPSFCDGQGGCALARDEASCPTGKYCATGSCTASLDAGADCLGTTTNSPDEACASGACLGGRCCTAPCGANDVECRAVACDSSGTCVYPDSTQSCGLPVCNGDLLAPAPTCDGQGNCVAGATTSCEPYACNATNSTCESSCSLDGGECASDTYCADGGCALKLGLRGDCTATSTSNASAACQSGVCCPHYFGCAGPEGCSTSCQFNVDCAVDAGAFCDLSTYPSTCCGFKSGDVLYVDGVGGNDAKSCCGDQATPCRTLTHAMDLIWNGNGRGVIVHAFNSDGSAAWGPHEGDIHLGLGVILDAPGILFSVGGPVFTVYGYTPADTDQVTIRGTAANPIRFGCVQHPSAVEDCPTLAINDEAVGNGPALPLVVSGVWITVAAPLFVQTGIAVGPGASVTLGPDPVTVELQSSFVVGIKCNGGALQDDPQVTSPVATFLGSVAPPDVLPFPGLFGTAYLDAEDCNVTLTQGPAFGNQDLPLPAGCDYRVRAAIVVGGNSQVSLGSAALPGSIQCAVVGIDEETGGGGSPVVNLQHMTIDLAATGDPNNDTAGTCAGAVVLAGTLTASNSTFVHSSIGVFVGATATAVDLSGGDGGGNTIGCNEEPAGYCPDRAAPLVPPSGGDLVNATAARSIHAQNTTWDHWSASTGTTQLWSCSDVKYISCVCSGPSCPGDGGAQALPPGADAVYLSTNVGTGPPIDSSQGTAATATSCP